MERLNRNLVPKNSGGSEIIRMCVQGLFNPARTNWSSCSAVRWGTLLCIAARMCRRRHAIDHFETTACKLTNTPVDAYFRHCSSRAPEHCPPEVPCIVRGAQAMWSSLANFTCPETILLRRNWVDDHWRETRDLVEQLK